MLCVAEDERAAAPAEHSVRHEGKDARPDAGPLHPGGGAALLDPGRVRDGIRHIRVQGGQGLQSRGGWAEERGPGTHFIHTHSYSRLVATDLQDQM